MYMEHRQHVLCIRYCLRSDRKLNARTCVHSLDADDNDDAAGGASVVMTMIYRPPYVVYYVLEHHETINMYCVCGTTYISMLVGDHRDKRNTISGIAGVTHHDTHSLGNDAHASATSSYWHNN